MAAMFVMDVVMIVVMIVIMAMTMVVIVTMKRGGERRLRAF